MNDPGHAPRANTRKTPARPAATAYTACMVFALLFSAVARGEKYFDFSPGCQLAYHEIISLRLSKGEQLLREEKAAHPNNLVPYLLDNYIDFFILYFNEDPEEFNRRRNNMDLRLGLLGEGPRSSPFYLFSMAVLHFQWAAVKIKFGHHWDAGWEFRRSFLQIRENRRRFPHFTPGTMLEGAMQVAAGTIPDGYRWLGTLLGISGTIPEGMKELETFMARDDALSQLFRDESIFYYLYLKFYIQNQRAAVFAFIRAHQLDIVHNHLFAYLAANLALNAQQSAYTEEIIRGMDHDEGYLKMPVWDLEMGTARMNHLEQDASSYLERFAGEFRGNFYLKEVLLKLSWYYFLAGNLPKANGYRKMVLLRGSTDTEADKQAMNEAASGLWPNPVLLRARLLDDGGYFQEALRALEEQKAESFGTPEEKLEYAYRLGRIYDDLNRKEEAISYYETAIRLGVRSRSYYAARAALQTGYIYEETQRYSDAIVYYKRCLAMRDHEYKNSLDQKAKAGMIRCREAQADQSRQR